jgi:hypothetical protein
MQVIKIIAFAAIGLFLGYVFWNLTESGYFQRWEKLSPPPQNIPEYFSLGEEQSSPSPIKIIKPCDYSFPEFSILSNSPQNMVDCVQRSEMYPDGYGRFASVLDGDGNVWQWTYITTAYDSLGSMLCWSGLGLLFGVIIAIVAKKPNQPHETNI